MQPAEELPEDVVRFIRDRIDTVPQLEALLLLQAETSRSWTCAQLAERLYISLREAEDAIARLVRLNLAVADSDRGFRFRTDSEHLASVARVGEAYRRHLVRIARMIHDKPPAALREFARAFDVSRERQR